MAQAFKVCDYDGPGIAVVQEDLVFIDGLDKYLFLEIDIIAAV
jgi:hypothetical protein